MVIPYHRVTLKSPLPADKAFDAIFVQTSRSDSRSFVGVADQMRFRVRRSIEGRNSFLPIVHGRISERAGGSLITIGMRPPLASLVFMALWFSLPMSAVRSGERGLPIAAGLAAFGYLFMMSLFWYEAIKQHLMLRDIFGVSRSRGEALA